MARRVRLVFYKDRDNAEDLTLLENLVPLSTVQMEAIAKISVRYMDNYYNSDDHPEAFDYATLKSTGRIVLKLGLILPVGSDSKSELIIFDAGNANGIVWTQLHIKVSAEAET